jgi:hypothetical protein
LDAKACYEDVVVASLTVFNVAIVVDIATAVLILILVAELVLVVAVGFVVVLLDVIC